MDEQDGIHMSTDVIKEASDECWGGDKRQIETKDMMNVRKWQRKTESYRQKKIRITNQQEAASYVVCR